MSVNAAESAVRYGMNVWNNAGANFAFAYGGRVTDTTVQNDHRNVVLFRDTADGSAHRDDLHLVEPEGRWSIPTSCSSPLRFSSSRGPDPVPAECLSRTSRRTNSAMRWGSCTPLWPTRRCTQVIVYCSQEERTLAADDIAGVRSLYGTNPNANTRPVVTITAPANGASVSGTIVFSGSASDTQDGNLSTSLVWTSSVDGAIGAGASFSKTLSPSTHVITASGDRQWRSRRFGDRIHHGHIVTAASAVGTNVALASAGAVASASSTYSAGYLPARRRSTASGRATVERGGGWTDGTLGSFPDWLEVDFATSYAISQVNVFSVQDNLPAPVEPTATQTFTLYGLRDFQVQVLDRHRLGAPCPAPPSPATPWCGAPSPSRR